MKPPGKHRFMWRGGSPETPKKTTGTKKTLQRASGAPPPTKKPSPPKPKATKPKPSQSAPKRTTSFKPPTGGANPSLNPINHRLRQSQSQTAPPSKSDPIWKIAGGLLLLAFLLYMCSGESSNKATSVVYRGSAAVYYSDNSVDVSGAAYRLKSSLQGLAKNQCRRSAMSVVVTSYYPGSNPLNITKTRARNMTGYVRSWLSSSRLSSLSVSWNTANYRQHPADRSTLRSGFARGRSVVLFVTCRK